MGIDYATVRKENVVSPKNNFKLHDLIDKIFRNLPPRKEIYSFFLQLSSFYEAKIGIVKALKIMSEQPCHSKLNVAIREMCVSLEESNSLSTAFAQQTIFPKYCSGILKAGENSGILSTLLVEIGLYVKQDGDVENSINSSMLVPKIVAVFLCIAIFVVFTFVIPKYIEIYKSMGIQLPILTSIVFGIYSFCKNHLLLIGIGMLSLIFFGLKFSHDHPDKIDILKLKIPIYKTLYYQVLQYRFSKSLSLFLSAKTGASEALQYTGNSMGNALAQRVLNQAAIKVIDGVPLSDAIKESNTAKIIDFMPINYITTGQETGNIPDLLEKAAAYYKTLIDLEIKDFSVRISTALLIPTACIELILLLSILLPSYSMVLGVK